tara:strand:+ start:32274 stop:33482 length:1209 start_codon:yes stop_codon:yes gene_type:complete
MSWNDPERDDKGKRKDPWGNQGDGPPDLDEALSQFQNKLRKMFGGGEGGGNGFQHPRGKTVKPGFLGFGLIGFILIAVYVVSGIYIVDPPEKAAVTRFGRYIETTGPGPHWLAPIIEHKQVVNVEKIHTETFSAHMLTKDKNIAQAEIAIQYRIDNPEAFLFNVSDPLKTLTLAMRSALRSGVGRATLDGIMTEGRTDASLYIKDQVQGILSDYQTGIKITRANLRRTTVPEGQVQEAYDDANAARQDQEKYINQAQAEKVKLINRSEGDSAAIIQAAEGYKASKILEAKGYAQKFLEMLPEYRAAPDITRDRLFIETMQEVYSNSNKVLMDVDNGNNLVYIPLDKIVGSKVAEKAYDSTAIYQPPASVSETPAIPSAYNSARANTRPTYSSSSRPTRGGTS